MFQKPPRPMLNNVSEMKEMYQQKHPTHGERLLDAPAEFARCDVSIIFSSIYFFEEQRNSIRCCWRGLL